MIAAILRIGASLDLDTVLREAVDGARSVTGVRYGAIYAPIIPDSPLDFVTSGCTAEEHGALAAWPEGLRLFGHLRGLAAPRRLPDLADYAHSLGCSPVPVLCRAFSWDPSAASWNGSARTAASHAPRKSSVPKSFGR